MTKLLCVVTRCRYRIFVLCVLRPRSSSPSRQTTSLPSPTRKEIVSNQTGIPRLARCGHGTSHCPRPASGRSSPRCERRTSEPIADRKCETRTQHGPVDGRHTILPLWLRVTLLGSCLDATRCIQYSSTLPCTDETRSAQHRCDIGRWHPSVARCYVDRVAASSHAPRVYMISARHRCQ